MVSSDRRLEARRRPRQVRAEFTRERILAAAAHIFTEHGYSAGTTNHIARHARISIGSLYQYFPNKDAILAGLLIQHIDRGAWTDVGDLDLSAGSLKTTVRSFTHDAIVNHSDDPRLLRMMVEQAPISRELLAAVDRRTKLRVAQVREILVRHPDIHVDDPDIAAELVEFTIETNTHKFMAGPRHTSVDIFENELATMITRYLRGDQ